MKYCSAQLEYVDKDLNLVPFKKVINRSGSAETEKQAHCKMGQNLNTMAGYKPSGRKQG